MGSLLSSEDSLCTPCPIISHPHWPSLESLSILVSSLSASAYAIPAAWECCSCPLFSPHMHTNTLANFYPSLTFVSFSGHNSCSAVEVWIPHSGTLDFYYSVLLCLFPAALSYIFYLFSQIYNSFCYLTIYYLNFNLL